MRYDTTDDLDFDVRDLLPALNRLENKLTKLEAATSSATWSDPDLAALLPHLQSLERRINRVAGTTNTLVRTLQRQRDAEATQAKARVPRVMKTMTTVGEGSQLLRDVQAAMSLGVYGDWAANYRRKLAEVA